MSVTPNIIAMFSSGEGNTNAIRAGGMRARGWAGAGEAGVSAVLL